MMKNITKIGLAILAVAAPIGPAVAQQEAPSVTKTESKIQLQSDVKAIVATTDSEGRAVTTLVEPREFTPGTKLSFGTHYSNNGTQAATNVTGTSPINPAVHLAPDADPALIVSVDGGETFGLLQDLAVDAPSTGSRPARNTDVTHVRWTIASIAPGESGRVAFPSVIR